MRESSPVSHPHPLPSPTGRGVLGKPLYEFPLPVGEGQGEGKSWHDSDLAKNFATLSGGRSDRISVGPASLPTVVATIR